MLTLIMYAICLCLAFKGVQIFQIAFVSTGPWRAQAIKLGIVSLVFAVGLATILAVLFTFKSWEFDRVLQQLSGPQVPFR